MKENKSVGWALYWVGYAICFGMLLADISNVETFTDQWLHMALTFLLSFTSWVGVGATLMNVLIGDV